MSLIPQDRSKLSPMMQQYLSMKDEHRDQILMFRLGDFYEMFFDDAVTASRELELTLTGRDCGLPDRAPMCGVPYHSVENYIARLVKKGYKVAICEQMEDPALAKGIVKRSAGQGDGQAGYCAGGDPRHPDGSQYAGGGQQ